MFVNCFIFSISLFHNFFFLFFSSRIEVAYQEAVALKRQEELIREEEAAGQAENELKGKRGASEKEKRAKKKQVSLSQLIPCVFSGFNLILFG